MTAIIPPYLLFLGDAENNLSAKTATGIAYWRPEKVVGQLRLPGCGADLGLADLSPREAAAKGARTMVIGTVSSGGYLPERWHPALLDALDAGLDLASGMHMRLSDVPVLAERAQARGAKLFDVRQPPMSFPTGTGATRTGKRLLTVGTDCAVGKMYTSLALERAMTARGMKATFRATGQTGIFIAGRGVSVDAVVSDFVSGAAEWLSPGNDPDHWDLIEGQGSLFHPAFAAVTLGLMHGSQADAFVVCHDAGRTHIRHIHYPLPSIAEVIRATVEMGRLTNARVRCVGLAVNTSRLGEKEAGALLETLRSEHGLPACDPVRTGVEPIVDRIQSDDA